MIDVSLLSQALSVRVADWTQQLEAKVRDNLSGGVLEARSGALLASIVSGVEDDGEAWSGFVASEGVSYAAIQEYGGKTAAHDIVATKARALAFVAQGGEVFARSVHHPGSVIPAHSYLGGALAAMQEAMTADLKQCVLDALTQS